MKETPSEETQSAARLLGRRGGTATLKKYGVKQLREWGKLGGKFGEMGGRPPKSKKTAKSQTTAVKTGANSKRRNER
jgi:hypothetical protein